MRYITGIERRAIEKGVRKGLLRSISLGLELKFGPNGLRLLAEISEISEIEDIETLQRIEDTLRTCSLIDEVKAVYLP